MACYKNLKTDRSIFLKNYLIENYSKKTIKEIIEETGFSQSLIYNVKSNINKIKKNNI